MVGFDVSLYEDLSWESPEEKQAVIKTIKERIFSHSFSDGIFSLREQDQDRDRDSFVEETVPVTVAGMAAIYTSLRLIVIFGFPHLDTLKACPFHMAPLLFFMKKCCYRWLNERN
jgi:hypothetical protein